MIEGSLGLIVEGLLSTLLVATIFYCISVNRKLERLRDEQKGMHQFIRELSVATAKADEAIQGLRATVQDSGEELASQIDKGRNMNRLLKGEIESAEQTISKLVIMIGHGETSQHARRSSVPQNTIDTVVETASDLRNTMLGFDDLELDAAPQAPQSTEDLMVDAKGII